MLTLLQKIKLAHQMRASIHEEKYGYHSVTINPKAGEQIATVIQTALDIIRDTSIVRVEFQFNDYRYIFYKEDGVVDDDSENPFMCGLAYIYGHLLREQKTPAIPAIPVWKTMDDDIAKIGD